MICGAERRDERQRHDNLLSGRRDRCLVGEQSARDQLAHHKQHRDRGDQAIACKRMTIEPTVEATEQRAKHTKARSGAADHVPRASSRPLQPQSDHAAIEPGGDRLGR
jgi:hypothetical protein